MSETVGNEVSPGTIEEQVGRSKEYKGPNEPVSVDPGIGFNEAGEIVPPPEEGDVPQGVVMKNLREMEKLLKNSKSFEVPDAPAGGSGTKYNEHGEIIPPEETPPK